MPVKVWLELGVDFARKTVDRQLPEARFGDSVIK